MRSGLRILVIVSAVVVSNLTFASGDVSSLLEKMTSADQKLNYEGVFILRKADKLMTMRVEHGVDERGVWESIEALNGEARKVIRLNETVTSIYPERKIITISQSRNKSSLHPALPENFDKLQSYYKITRLDDERIAGHEAAVLDVKPNDSYRYGYRYWLDIQTGVLLKCDLLNEQSDVVEQMVFTTLVYLPEVPALAFSEAALPDNYKTQLLDAERVTVDHAKWHTMGLPAGFMLTQSSQRQGQAAESLHLVYSDGLASVSVFIEQGEASHHRLEGASVMGALNAYGTRLDDYYITVMGEAPASTVRQIALTTEPVKDQVE